MLSDAEREELLEMAASDALLAFLSYQARAFAAERFQRPPAEGRMLL